MLNRVKVWLSETQYLRFILSLENFRLSLGQLVTDYGECFVFNLKFSHVLATLFIATSYAQPVLAQTQPSEVITSEDQEYRHTRVLREVQPIPYWVDTASLKLRDNPVSGKVLGELEYGQKILAYSQYENWVRVSKGDANPRWINSDFLSNSRISWASFNRSNSARLSDVVSARIKDPQNRKNRIFGVRLKTADTGNALITTRENTAEGVLYKNHFVSCNDQRVLGIKLVGEGYNFLSAQNDIRNLAVDIYEDRATDRKAANSVETAISHFACKAQPF